MKRCHFLEDRDGYKYELCYVRDKDGREVDFVILKDGVPVSLIEAKYADENVSRPLSYYSRKLSPLETIQLVAELDRPYDAGDIKVMSPLEYFKGFDCRDFAES